MATPSIALRGGLVIRKQSNVMDSASTGFMKVHENGDTQVSVKPVGDGTVIVNILSSVISTSRR